MTITLCPFKSAPSPKSVAPVRRIFQRLMAIGCAILITACGGGGGGGTGSVTPGPIVVTPPPVITPDTAIVTSVPVATYMAGTGESAAFTLINSERQRCGFGLMAQNAQLDVAAAAHVKYSVTNNVLGHVEDPAKTDFYGATVIDRFTKVGYQFSTTGEVGSITVHFTSRVGDGQPTSLVAGASYAVHRLLAAPYHSQELLDGYRDAGIGLNGPFMFVNTGTAPGKALQMSADVRTYPCEGTAGTMANTRGETPSPFAAEGSDVQWGQPVIVYGAPDLKVTSASVTGPLGSVAIKALYGNGGSVDPNGYFKNSDVSGKFAIIPSATLATNTTYTVTINGINKASPFTRTFSFTTGAYTGTGYYPTGQF